MTKYRFVNQRFRPTNFFRLLLVTGISLCFALCVNAQTSAQNPVMTQEDQTGTGASGVIDAVVKEIQGTHLLLEGGLVIDISKASLLSPGGAYNLPITSIKPGMTVRVSYISFDNASSVLIAGFVRVRLEDEVILSGVLQTADLDNGVLTLLGQRIVINSETIIPIGFKHKKLRPGLQVCVIVKHNGSDLLATYLLPYLEVPRILP